MRRRVFFFFFGHPVGGCKKKAKRDLKCVYSNNPGRGQGETKKENL